MITVQEMNGHARKLSAAYERALLPLSRKLGMPVTAISILLFLANNPDFATARDVCEMRGLKRAIVSTHVDRLVREGLLERRTCPEDRRKDLLSCTPMAEPLIEAGRAAQKDFAQSVLRGLSAQQLTVMEQCFQIMDSNIEKLVD